MHTDPIADLLTRIRNASQAHHQKLNAPYSKIKENILKVMKGFNFIADYKVEGEGVAKELVVELAENNGDIKFKRVSKPGQRIYVKSEDLKVIKSGLGIQILSTSKGIMTNIEAKKQNIGGELICEIS